MSLREVPQNGATKQSHNHEYCEIATPRPRSGLAMTTVMPLVFAAHLPHSPLLLPAIGRENREKLAQTLDAFAELERALYATKPDTIVVISGHGTVFEDAFSMNVMESYKVNLKEFGDLTTDATFRCNLGLAQDIKEAAKLAGIPLALQSDTVLDYGSAVPVLLLTAHLPKVTVVPIGYSLLPAKAHFEFGYLLKDQIMTRQERVAVISSGDLSHCLTTNAPGGFKAQGPEFDAKVQEAIVNKNSTALLQMDTKLIESAEECSIRALWILFGALQRVSFEVKVLSYQAPFGVGHLVAQFVL